MTEDKKAPAMSQLMFDAYAQITLKDEVSAQRELICHLLGTMAALLQFLEIHHPESPELKELIEDNNKVILPMVMALVDEKKAPCGQ